MVHDERTNNDDFDRWPEVVEIIIRQYSEGTLDMPAALAALAGWGLTPDAAALADAAAARYARDYFLWAGQRALAADADDDLRNAITILARRAATTTATQR